jgi:hypothetical protein
MTMRCYSGPGVALVSAIVAVVAASAPAQAQSPAPPTATGGSNVAAEALFEDARGLVASGQFAEACPKFAESERLGPSVATLLNLANCWEKAGHTATAWATYREAASAANAAGRKDYLATALRRADGLAPKLARLTIAVTQPTAGLQVKRDGVVVESAEWGTGIPVDTGSHSIEATAPGHKAWQVALEVAQDGAQASVTVPALEEQPVDATAAAATPVPAPGSSSTPPSTPPPTEENSAPGSGGTQRVIGAVVAGVGVVGLGVGAVFAILAKSKYNESKENGQCPNDPNICSATGVSERDTARSDGNVATVALSVGAAALVAGGVLWFTAAHGPRPTSGSLQVSPTLGGFVARGSW